jgi:phospholipid/cholesterol/gamma-HCH transport system substrate-binding protein
MEKSNNVAAGDEVSIKGVAVGEIESVNLRDSKVAATIKIKKEIIIPIGSNFIIENRGLFGEKHISIIPSEASEYIKANSIVNSESTVAEPTDLAKAVGSLVTAAQAVEINKKLDSVIILLNKNKTNSK